MYSEDKTVAGAQHIMLEILKVVHRICEEHQIRYFLEGGTLLGAIRHDGFIPWDDDLDISMPREDYEKFLKLAPECLPQDMLLQTTAIEPAFRLPFAKIRKKGTALLEFHEDGTEAYHHGIFIDIFPLDYYKHSWFICWMRWTNYVRGRRLKYPKGTWKRLLVTVYTHYILFIPIEFSHFVRYFFTKHKEFFKDKNAEFMTFGLEYEEKNVTRTKDILPVKFVDNVFEGYGFYLPANPQAYLKGCFGSDYMQIPPKEKQRTHAKEIRLHVD